MNEKRAPARLRFRMAAVVPLAWSTAWAGGMAGCANLIGIDQAYQTETDGEDAGDSPPSDAARRDTGSPADTGGPEDTGSPADTGATDGGSFDCEAVQGVVWSEHCYFAIAVGTGLLWDQANDTCERFSGSHLVTVSSAEEQDMLEASFFATATEDHWIGLAVDESARDIPESTCRADPATCPFVWVTGEALSFTDWGLRDTGDEPNYSGDCVRIQIADLAWADNPCDVQLPAICEHE